ncbi:MAG: membrane protein insertase YidC [Anaerolineae bacterium]|nr:membrane protein insertase YidC [Anaerolineae bacterium]
MWEALVITPIINLLLYLYQLLGNETMVAVAVLTFLFRTALIPLTLSQQKSAAKQQALQPKLKKLQEKYKNDQERLAQEQMKLYKEEGINPMGGCLPLLIQFPLMLGFYQAIIRTLASSPLELLALPQHIYSWAPGLSSLIPLKSNFLWLDLALPDPYYVLPILVGVTTFLQQKLMTSTMPNDNPQAQAMNQQMLIMMPLFLGFVSLNYAAGLSVYLLISNLVGIVQYYLFRKRLYQQMQQSVA